MCAIMEISLLYFQKQKGVNIILTGAFTHPYSVAWELNEQCANKTECLS